MSSNASPKVFKSAFISGSSFGEIWRITNDMDDLELANDIAQAPLPPHIEHLRHHVQLNAGVLMASKAVVSIAFDGIDVLDLSCDRDRRTHRVIHAGHCGDQQVVQPQLIEL